MRYTGLELFMKNLKHMIYSDDNPLISNHPSILSQRPELQLLYEEFDSVIQTVLLIDEQYQELQQVKDLQRRIKDAAEDAHDIIDLFVYEINLGNQMSHMTSSLISLKDVMRSIKSIKKEFITILDNFKMDSSPSSDPIRTPCPERPLGRRKAYEEDIVVGFDHHVELIRDKLVEDQKQLDVVSIVGMGGLGKTTVATKVFNDPFIMHHFYVRGWVVVSQKYDKMDLLVQILKSIGHKEDKLRDRYYPQLRQMLRQNLMHKRYLIVIDDIWTTDAWDDLKLSFPNDHNGSRILLTSRLKEIALHAKSHGFIHQLEFLTEKESWELLRKKVFHGSNDCPEWLIEPGMKIAKNCHGLPLMLVVIAGVLAKEELTKDSWERIGRGVSSHVVGGQMDYIEQLALSFDHLPGHLRDCFLYLGGFPEDYKFRVQRLIRLWMAEGFIQEDGTRSLESIGVDCLMELVDRNLVVVADRKSNGGVKTFYVHDLLRELCFKIATKEKVFLKARHTTQSVETYMQQRRLFIESDIIITNASRIRSLVCVYEHQTEIFLNKHFHLLRLLVVMDLRYGVLDCFPDMSQLVHLRYLAISYGNFREFPSSICKLWSLQTIIISKCWYIKLPKTISDLVNLRHFILEDKMASILFPAIQKPMNLQTITSNVELDGAESWVKCFPNIKKLSCVVRRYMDCDFASLTSLENLKVSRGNSDLASLITSLENLKVSVGNQFVRNNLKFREFPPLLKSLTLQWCLLPWSDISIIRSLPNLEVLKLLSDSFKGPRWDAGEEPFWQLKVLKLEDLNFKEWEASSINFPCLKQLVVTICDNLEEIPTDLGNIPTLELISIEFCNDSVVESVETIKEEQHAQGNFELKVSVRTYKSDGGINSS